MSLQLDYEIISRSRSPSPAGACSRGTKDRLSSSPARSPESAYVSASIASEATRVWKRRRRPRPEPRSKSGRCRLGVRWISVCAHRVRAAAPAEVGSDRRRICTHRQDATRRAGRRTCVQGRGLSHARPSSRATWEVGFFREGTHDLCDAALTRQLLPDSIDALRRLEGATARRRGHVVRAFRERRRDRAGGAAGIGAVGSRA